MNASIDFLDALTINYQMTLLNLHLAALQYRIDRVTSIADYAAKLDRLVASAGDAELLLMPEYAAVELAASLSDHEGKAIAELAAMRIHTPQILRIMCDVAKRHRKWLLPGTLPWPRGQETVNIALLINPAGQVALQEKCMTTRFESEEWNVSTGKQPGIFETPWGRIGITICRDVGFPNLVRAQVNAGAWLILVPSSTDTMHDFNRISLAARARAIENQCYVAIAPTVGKAPWSATLGENRGYAAVYGPIEENFPEDGIIARGAMDTGQWVHALLDRRAIDTLRASGATWNHLDWPDASAPAEVREFG